MLIVEMAFSGGTYGTPLQAAAAKSRTDIMKLLLKGKGSPNVIGAYIFYYGLTHSGFGFPRWPVWDGDPSSIICWRH
jgi:hypothetical protein